MQALDLARFALRPATIIAARLAVGASEASEHSWEGAAGEVSAGDIDVYGGTALAA